MFLNIIKRVLPITLTKPHHSVLPHGTLTSVRRTLTFTKGELFWLFFLLLSTGTLAIYLFTQKTGDTYQAKPLLYSMTRLRFLQYKMPHFETGKHSSLSKPVSLGSQPHVQCIYSVSVSNGLPSKGSISSVETQQLKDLIWSSDLLTQKYRQGSSRLQIPH